MFCVKSSHLFRSVVSITARFVVLCLPVLVLPVSFLNAEEGSSHISPDFRTPPLLRSRVNFWLDVFTRYGEHQKVVHHRLYPQVVFGILDFSKEAAKLDAIDLRRLMKEEEERSVQRVKAALSRLSEGHAPSNQVERHIANAMSIVRGGPEKYRDVLNNDWVRTQTGIREKSMEAIRRSGRYLHIMERIFVEEFNLPRELTRLPFIESTFNYQAVSSCGAAGLWQFMSATGKGFGMRINRFVDERKDPIIASRAAAQYLKRAYNRLGSWDLAVTSYNHGITGVLRRINNSGTRNLVRLIESGPSNPFGFASSNFWPEFLAAVEIFSNPGKFFPGLEVDPPLHLTERRLTGSTTAQSLTRQTGLSPEVLRIANYALSDAVWDGKAQIPAGYVLRVPENYSARLARASFQPTSPLPVSSGYGSSAIYGGIKYTVRKGDTLLAIAKKYSTSVGALKKLNGLTSSSVRPGQVLMIEKPGKPEASQVQAESGAHEEKAGGGKKQKHTGNTRYTVRKGDTLGGIARMFKVSAESIRKLNGLRSDNIKLGQSLRIK